MAYLLRYLCLSLESDFHEQCLIQAENMFDQATTLHNAGTILISLSNKLYQLEND